MPERTLKEQAVFVLDAELNEMEYSPEAARAITDDVIVDYFSGNRNPPEDDKHRLQLAYDYHKNMVKMGIIFDYILKALNQIRALQNEMDKHQESEIKEGVV